MGKPKLAPIARKRKFGIKGDTGLYDAVNEGEQKADIVNGIRVIEDDMDRKDGGGKVITARNRYVQPTRRKAPGVREPVDKRRAGEHYDPFFEDRLGDAIIEMKDYLRERSENEI
jgi:hypothetical protein|tara:strand:- start:128 stop:472 length:345 start_codon:yes stop_codon:yes gene_type:complete